MAENTVQLNLTARDQASSVIRGVMGSLQGMLGQIAMIAGAAGAGMGLGALVKEGIEFNKTMEDSRSGIASLILANNQLLDSYGNALGPAQALTQAFRIAEGVQADLRKSALTTAASYQELVKGFQTAYGPATAAGITSLSKIKEITVSASQAVAALGLDSRQTSQELRALFTGEQGPDNTLTRTLGITKAEMDRVRASGEDLGDFLISKLKPFADVASRSMGNFSTVVSNLGDAMDQISGEAFAPLFREIKSLATGLGGTAGSLSGGLGVIGQGLADGLRALGPFLQALAGLGVAAAKAGTTFLAAFAPIVPALTGLTNVVTGLVDGLGVHAIALWASVKAFHAFGPAAVAAAQALSLFFAKMQIVSGAENAAGLARLGAAFATLGASVTAAQVAMAAVPAAIAAILLAGLKLKGMWEDSKADEAWARAATTQQTFIEVLERKYQKTVDITASEELLNMAHAQRALVMARVIQLDKDGVITLDDVKSAIAAMTEETMKAKNVAAGFADMQEKTKEKYADLLAALKAEIRIGGLEGLKKDLAVVGEEFRKKRDQIRKDFFDAGSGQWAQDPKALFGLLGISETQQITQKAREFAKAFKAVPEEIVATWDIELKKLPDKVKIYLSKAADASVVTMSVWRKRLGIEIENLLNEFRGMSDASNGVLAAQKAILMTLPTAAESAYNAVRSVWDATRRGFDDVFGSVFTGRLDNLKNVFQSFADSLGQTFAVLVSDMVQRWLTGQESISDGLKNLSKSMQSANGGLSVEGGLMAGGVGYGIGGMVGQGTQYNQIGGAVGAAGGAYVGGLIGSGIAPVIGTIVGAIIGALIGELFNPNTEKSIVGSLGGMVGATSWQKVPIYDPTRRGGPSGLDDEPFDPGEPIGWQDIGTLQSPTTAFERSGQKVFESQTAAFADLFKLGAKDQARELLGAYQGALKESLSGAWFKIAAGSQEDIEKDAEILLKTLLPRIGLSAAFGQTGYLPSGDRDAPGGIPGINWGMPGMGANGAWEGAKQLFDPEAPIPKMLAGLGFTSEKIGELAGRISTDDPAKLLAYITGIVGVVVGLKKLGEELGQSFDELRAGWAAEAAAGPAAALGKQAADLATLFDDLTLYSGDDQLKKAQEAQAASEQFWQGVVSYLQQLDALAQKLSAGLQGMRAQMRAFLSPLSESGQMEADWSNVEGVWGRLFGAMDAGQVEAATNEAAAAIERMFEVLSERVTRGKALLDRIGGLLGRLGSLRYDVYSEQKEKTNPLEEWGTDLVTIQRQVQDAARLSGLEQIAAIEGAAGAAETLYGNLKGLLAEISTTSASIAKSIGAQIWELGVGELDAPGQATAVTDRIKELQDQLALATSPAEIAAITSEIQSLTSRYVGTFGKDDPKRAEAIAWAQEQLERAKGLAQDALDAMRELAEAQAKELEDILKGAADLISTNVNDAATAIGQLSYTLGELDKAVQEALKRLGQDALDSLGPLREAMEGAAEIFTGATGAAAESLTAEAGFTAATERSTARLNTFADALDRATAKLNGVGSGAPAGPQQVQVVQQAPASRTSSAEIVSTVRRFSRQLTPRVA